MKWSSFEHQIYRRLQESAEFLPEGRGFLVALSGGADSVAALLVLKRLGFEVKAHHCHHGHSSDSKTLQYREQAVDFCESLCSRWSLELSVDKSPEYLNSEEDMRDFRIQSLQKKLATLNSKSVSEKKWHLVFGHHQDDLLETRLMRLIRGTGHQGLEAMATLKEGVLRPLLEVPKAEILSYIQSQSESFIDDPSNESEEYFRNWIRHSWLKSLELRQAGASQSLARSLETLIQEWSTLQRQSLLEKNRLYSSEGLSRQFYLSLDAFEREILLAQYLLSLQKRDFSQGHIREITKRLDNSQNEYTFTVAGLNWLVNAGQIKVLL